MKKMAALILALGMTFLSAGALAHDHRETPDTIRVINDYNHIIADLSVGSDAALDAYGHDRAFYTLTYGPDISQYNDNPIYYADAFHIGFMQDNPMASFMLYTLRDQDTLVELFAPFVMALGQMCDYDAKTIDDCITWLEGACYTYPEYKFGSYHVRYFWAGAPVLDFDLVTNGK